MKKIKILPALFTIVAMLSSCSEEEPVLHVPDEGQMKYICELATMDCYYNNIAKYFEQDATGSLLWKKDKHFWIEYNGIVRVGLDIEHLEISVSKDKITIKLPMATTLSSKVDETTLTENSFLLAKGSADIDVTDQTKAFEEAQENMLAIAASDENMLNSARERAKTLLTEYIESISKATGALYQIEWVYLDKDGKAI